MQPLPEDSHFLLYLPADLIEHGGGLLLNLTTEGIELVVEPICQESMLLFVLGDIFCYIFEFLFDFLVVFVDS